MARSVRIHHAVSALALAVGLAVTAPARAEDWPTRPISLVVPFGPGSGTDLVARQIAAPLGERLGQPVIIQNMGGAGGLIGVSRVAKANPDGYEMVVGSLDTFAQSPSLRKQPPYDSIKDFEPAGLAVVQPLILIARKDLPVSNLREFAAYVKQNGSKMQFGSAGVGTANHLVCYELTRALGANVTHVSYRGSAEAMTDMLAGHLDFYCILAIGAVPYIKSGTLKAIAVLTDERSPALPDVPTAKEQGFDFGNFYYWMGLFFPKGTPAPIVTKLNSALNATLDNPDLQAHLRAVATSVAPPEHRSPDYLRGFLASEIKTWAAAIKASGIQPN
ncbi:MAG TPA: tripartite tricarboxylate transporter substrate binding protein [Xanthobacteraceae bacterium]|nr:tripartite tricarboxylate transporter substrate binding protein [Xanthobacteraceae bacterium]